MLYLGLNAGVVAGNAAAHAVGLNAFRMFVATLVLIVCGLIGARLFYIATHWPHYRLRPGRIWNRNEGGAAQYGALAIALPIAVPLLAALHLPFGASFDVASFTLLVAMIFGRTGCLLNGCCAGRPSESWVSLYSPNLLGIWEKRIPTQCLEAAWAAVLLACAIVIWPRLPFPGALFLLVASGYALGRLVLESTRERHAGAGGLTIHHGISVILILVSLAVLTARWPK